MIRALADARRSSPGACAICGISATQWHRSGRRDTDADGLTLAARCCDEHEQTLLAALRALTIANIAALVPHSRRTTRATGAASRADRLLTRARSHQRSSAALRGASSATHTHALLGGMASLEAEALRRLAGALLAVRS